MISFIAPATSDFFSENVEFTVDVNPVLAKEVRQLIFKAKEFPFIQSRPDGINVVTPVFSFAIVNLPISQVYALDGFFNELNAVNKLTFTFPEGTLQTTIRSWEVVIPNAKYGSIYATAERAYL